MSPKKRRKPKFTLPEPMSDDALREFVNRFVSGDVVHSNLPGIQSVLHMVFMPIAFGVFQGASKKQLEQIGLIFEYFNGTKRAYHCINGFPIFYSARIMLKSDLARASPVIEAELERRKKLEIPK